MNIFKKQNSEDKKQDTKKESAADNKKQQDGQKPDPHANGDGIRTHTKNSRHNRLLILAGARGIEPRSRVLETGILNLCCTR